MEKNIICPKCGYKIRHLKTYELFIKEAETILKKTMNPMRSEEIYNILFKKKEGWKKYSFKQLSCFLGCATWKSKTIIVEQVYGKLRTGTYAQDVRIYYHSDPCPNCNSKLTPEINQDNNEILLCEKCHFVKKKPFNIYLKKGK